MKVGAYIVNHNYGRYVQWAMRSMQAQTMKPDILIFIDDASTDNSRDILVREMEISGMFFDEIVVNEVNLGTSKTINKAVDILVDKYKCDCVFGLSADDTIEPTYLEKVYNELEKAPKNVGWIYTWVKEIGDRLCVTKYGEYDSDNLKRYNFCHGSSLIKAKAWQSVGGLPDIDFEEDWAMFRNMSNIGWIGKLIAEPILNWRRHGKSRTIKGMQERGLI